MQILRKKWKIGVPFGKKGKRLCPSNTVMLRKKLCCEAKPFSYFLQTAKLYYIQGHSNFSKKAKALSKVVEGRSLHSVPLAFWSISQKSQFISSGATRKFCDISWNFLRQPGAGRLGKEPVKNKKQAPEPLGGGACVFDFCVVLLSFLVCPWI